MQEFLFIPLDIYFKYHHNKGIRNELEAWLTFLGDDKPEDMIGLMEQYPQFGDMYADVYEMCRNTERVMEMFSKELKELDRNTTLYMIDEMQAELDTKSATISDQTEQLAKKDMTINNQNATISKQKKQLEGKDAELADKNAELADKNAELADRDAEIAALKEKLSKYGD